MFSLKDVGDMHYYLGIEAQYTSTGKIHLSQSKYVQYLLHKAAMSNSKSMPNANYT